MMFDFDPSKMDPKALMELSQLIQQLPPEQLNKMQSLMHNMQAGFDVRAQMEEFERSLPAGFREKILGIMAQSGIAPGSGPSATPVSSTVESSSAVGPDLDIREARLTILRAVSERQINPEEALQLLFPG